MKNRNGGKPEIFVIFSFNSQIEFYILDKHSSPRISLKKISKIRSSFFFHIT